MEISEDLAKATATVPTKIWKRYVDDSFIIIKKDSATAFHGILNSTDPTISFTIENENNGQTAFLDTVVTKRDGFITNDVSRKAAHTDRYLDFASHHEENKKRPIPRIQPPE